ncbi:GNAT family N-acetyltransferase [Priestia taiwanensis]|uniref:Acetyltransferase n=1 Tax=Priestia taiwanensis TaxID=1347902 RepID=A0A917EMY1_9BACI|nr:GNAT family N-acetyltransferase [Priestia taiwanensis]MBM7361931.1 RimJ/RimL family protein N-acetyltransferase [Priestia taiwanensis]GGE58100.1 putative acetyltransferase [Priestia taiwanensis]
MAVVSETIIDFWRKPFLDGEVLYRNEVFTVVVNPNLDEDRRVMVLETSDNKVMVTLTPTMVEKIGLEIGQELSEGIFRQKLNEAGVMLHGADFLFYFSEEDKNVLVQEEIEGEVRQLTAQDNTVFSQFEGAASEQDLDDAYVELDHWAVFGSFEQKRLVAATSMYPWQDAQIADLGVLTLQAFRGKGHARRVVRAISKYALAKGYEPQYRCQLDNEASTALAKATGLTLFGKWDVISPDSVY